MASPTTASTIKISLVDEMIVKELINIVYVALYGFGDVSLYCNYSKKDDGKDRGNIEKMDEKDKGKEKGKV